MTDLDWFERMCQEMDAEAAKARATWAVDEADGEDDEGVEGVVGI